jgi:hypothetical protein
MLPQSHIRFHLGSSSLFQGPLDASPPSDNQVIQRQRSRPVYESRMNHYNRWVIVEAGRLFCAIIFPWGCCSKNSAVGP